jgi:hypothetical protein
LLRQLVGLATPILLLRTSASRPPIRRASSLVSSFAADRRPGLVIVI